MKLSLIDFHCDTLYEMYVHGKTFEDPSLAICFRDVPHDVYDHYVQIAALWSDSKHTDEEAFRQFEKSIAFFQSKAFQQKEFELIRQFDSTSLFSSPANQLILAVEDARLLSGSLQRLRFFYSVGVRFLTLLWSGTSCIGGAYDTSIGLTPFGRSVVSECAKLGIIPDISHASIPSAYEILEFSNRMPVIASHSDSYTVFPHPRNISDELFLLVKSSGGIVGINLYTEHLGIGTLSGSDLEIILRHIDHFLSIDGEDVICFGCDFDGAETPKELRHPRDLNKLAEAMLKRGYSQNVIEKLFWKNAKRFLLKNIFNNINET